MKKRILAVIGFIVLIGFLEFCLYVTTEKIEMSDFWSANLVMGASLSITGLIILFALTVTDWNEWGNKK